MAAREDVDLVPLVLGRLVDRRCCTTRAVRSRVGEGRRRAHWLDREDLSGRKYGSTGKRVREVTPYRVESRCSRRSDPSSSACVVPEWARSESRARTSTQAAAPEQEPAMGIARHNHQRPSDGRRFLRQEQKRHVGIHRSLSFTLIVEFIAW